MVTDSTTKAEYIAASEAIWIKKFVSKLSVVPSCSCLIDLYCDNNGAIAQAKEPGRTKNPSIYYGAIT